MNEDAEMNTGARYRLAEGVAIRPERFGALVYRYDNRRLYFIHSRTAADFVGGLDGAQPLDQAIARFVDRHDLPDATGASLLSTMGKLEKMGLVSAVAVS